MVQSNWPYKLIKFDWSDKKNCNPVNFGRQRHHSVSCLFVQWDAVIQLVLLVQACCCLHFVIDVHASVMFHTVNSFAHESAVIPL
jgi:hypothetical protein